MEGVPRNWLLYRVLSLVIPDIFQCVLTGRVHMGGKDGKKQSLAGQIGKPQCPPDSLRILFPRFPTDANSDRGDPLSIWRFLQGAAATQFSQAVVRAAHNLQTELGDDLGLRLANLLVEQKMLIPPAGMSALVARVLRAGMAGQKVIVGGAFCPDYAYVKTGNPDQPYKYTFDSVGRGIGLVAQQFARIVPEVSAFLSGLSIDHEIILGIGDFEAHSQSILDSVGVTKGEFFDCCRASLAAFRDAVPAHIPMTLEMCWEDRGRDRLQEYSEAATARMMVGDFGCMPDVFSDWAEIVDQIPGQNRSFYEDWYKKEMSDEEVMRKILTQAGEYAALAQISLEDFGENVLMLAGDRPEMNKFNCFPAPLATLCAKRAY